MSRPPPRSTLFPYTTLFRSKNSCARTKARMKRCMISELASAHLLSTFSEVNWKSGTSWRGSQRLPKPWSRSEEHTSELQSHVNLVCRLLLEKKKTQKVEVRY